MAKALNRSDFLTGDAVLARLDDLARDSDEAGALTRLVFTPAHRLAIARVAGWMRAAGLATRVDALGTVTGRLDGVRPGLPALLIGSHIDTVRDAGRYDGSLGVALGIGLCARLAAAGARLPFAIEVLAFGDEEGVRFPATLTSSRAVAGRFDPAFLAMRDGNGVTYAEALRAIGGDPAAIAVIARQPGEVLAWLEAHIEQGPVLEAEGLPVGIVSGIAAVTRVRVTVEGMAGHAGTVPMQLRRDALAGAAEMISGIERAARAMGDVVATVGVVTPHPGARNVIPGRVDFTVDYRAVDGARRDALGRRIAKLIGAAAARRGLAAAIERDYDEAATPCHPAIIEGLSAAISARGLAVRRLPSGAGHDGQAFRGFCPVGMLFVRCAGGVSHHPAESVTAADVGVALDVLGDFVQRLDPAALAAGPARKRG